MEELGDELIDPEYRMTPYDLDGLERVADGNPEGEDAQRYRKVNQEGNQPIFGLAILDEAEDPPAIGQSAMCVSSPPWRMGDVSSTKTTKDKLGLTQ